MIKMWRKRIISLLMVLVLVAGLLPVAAPVLAQSSNLVSPVVDNATGDVTFNYQGSVTDAVYVTGSFTGFSDWNDGKIKLTNTGNDDVYSTTVTGLLPGNYEYKFIVDGNWITDTLNTAPLSSGNSTFSIVSTSSTVSPVINASAGTVTFNFEPMGSYVNATSVYVAGNFTEPVWGDGKKELTKGADGIFSLTMSLSPGSYQYKFIVDTVWIADPLNSSKVGDNSAFIMPNPSGLTSPIVNASEGAATFIFRPEGQFANATEAYLAGQFTDWANGRIKMTKGADGNFSTTVNLAPGTYEYKIIVNGTTWITDPLNPILSADSNSVVIIPGVVLSGNSPAGVGSHKYTATLTDATGKGTDLTNSSDWSIKAPVPAGMSIDNSGTLTTTSETPNGRFTLVVSYDDNGSTKTLEKSLYYTKRALLLQYSDSDATSNTDLWVWGNSDAAGEYEFSNINSIRTSRITLSDSDIVDVGFIVRLYGAWGGNDREYEGRTISTNSGETYTKAKVVRGSKEVHVLPSGKTGFENGIVFRYRDDELFYQNKMDQVSSVNVIINGVSHPMTYSASDELFSFPYQNIAEGDYEYYFEITKNGSTISVNDQYNARVQNGHSVLTYTIPEVKISTSVKPAAINYDQNAVLSVNVETDANIKSIYADLNELGVNQLLYLDPELKSGSIYVSERATAGIKNIPVTVVDEFGNPHIANASITINPNTTTDFDWDEARIYFLLTDRFFDGDSSNNGADFDKNYAESYHGGDLAGVTAKLDYLQELGINTIWISPIVDNIDQMMDPVAKQYGYHGYWAKDFTKIDEHFGNVQDYKNLLDAAHERGIKVMVDVVLNHAGYETYEDPVFKDMLRKNPGSDLITQELSGLPDFVTEDPAVREKLINWQLAWANLTTDKGNKVDYFRVDTIKHVEYTTWKAFKNELTKANPDFKLIGEFFDASIDSHGGYLGDGQMDSVLDFDFKNVASRFVNGSINSVESDLEERNDKLTNYLTVGQFLSSHDENGFLHSRLDGDTSKMKVAAALQITIKGQPVVYYGEEINLSGPNSYNVLANNRYDMQWSGLSDEQLSTLDHYTKLLNIRESYSKIFSKGTHSKVGGSDSDKYLAFARTYNNESVVVALNTATTAKDVTLTVPFAAGTALVDPYNEQSYVVEDDGTVAFTIPASSDGGTVILAAANEIESLQPVNVTTTVGKAPVLPFYVTAKYADLKTASVKVKWDIISASQYATAGSFEVNGTVAGTALKAKATITVNATGGGSGSGGSGGGSSSTSSGSSTGSASDTLTTTIDQAAVNQAIQAKSNGTVTLDVNAGANVQQITVNIPLSTLANLDSSVTHVKLKAGDVSVTLPVEVLKSYIYTKTNSIQWIITKVANTANKYTVVLNADGKQVTTLSNPAQIELSYTVKSDQTPEKLIIRQWNGVISQIIANGKFNSQAGVMQFTTSTLGTFSIDYRNVTFNDIAKLTWAKLSIESLASKGIVTGVTEDKFNPSSNVTRAEFLTLLMRTFGLTNSEAQATFSDTPSSAWYYSYVASAQSLGIVNGTADGKFNPNEQISRQDMAVMTYQLLSALQISLANGSGSSYSDANVISPYALEAIQSLSQAGIMQGNNNNFNPKGAATRAEAAVLIYNLIK